MCLSLPVCDRLKNDAQVGFIIFYFISMNICGIWVKKNPDFSAWVCSLSKTDKWPYTNYLLEEGGNVQENLAVLTNLVELLTLLSSAGKKWQWIDQNARRKERHTYSRGYQLARMAWLHLSMAPKWSLAGLKG